MYSYPFKDKQWHELTDEDKLTLRGINAELLYENLTDQQKAGIEAQEVEDQKRCMRILAKHGALKKKKGAKKKEKQKHYKHV